MKNHLRTTVIVSILAVLLLLLYVRMVPAEVVEVDSGHRLVMGTFSRVVVIARGKRAANRCITAAFDLQNHIESLMSYHRDDSELNKINRYAAQGPVPVSEMTFEVLQQAVHFSKLSDGAFDVTVGPLVDLWRKPAKRTSLPRQRLWRRLAARSVSTS